jgi:integrase/recombinase XerD
MPKGLYQRNGIYWARFKVRGIEYRESLRTRSLAVAERRLKARAIQVQEQAYFGASRARVVAGCCSVMGEGHGLSSA